MASGFLKKWSWKKRILLGLFLALVVWLGYEVITYPDGNA
jgi:hypothetical protein